MKYLKISILFFAIFTLLAVSCQGVLAQTPDILQNVKNVRVPAGYGEETDVSKLVGNIINIILSIIGIILMIYLFTGGVMWMTSAGSSEKIKKAREMIVNAILGLVIVILSYAVATFIIKKAAGITE